jgi:large subunit ribosomal protein L18
VSIRKKLEGTAERPRLSVFRSAKHIYVQAVDDTTNTCWPRPRISRRQSRLALTGKKKDKAKAVGQALAKKLLAKNITACVFDRNGFIYHGRVSAVADGAREGGLKF